MVEAMRQTGIHPAKSHAFEQTGLLVTEDTQHLIVDRDLALAEWHAAIEEFKQLQLGGDSPA